MADLLEPDFGTAIYRSNDNIQNLKIRVVIKKVTSSTALPQSIFGKHAAGGGAGMELADLRLKHSLSSQPQDSDEYIFGYQEKLFSQREWDLYSSLGNCQTVLEKKYHEEVKHTRTRPTTRLFSYVDHDTFTNIDERAQRMTTSAAEVPTFLAERMTTVRRRRTRPARTADGEEAVVPKINIVNLNPTPEKMSNSHILTTPVQTMYIMADLSPKHREQKLSSDEYVLCTIKVDAHGVITTKPDFNRGQKPYTVETDGLGKEVFEYWIESVSQQMSCRERDGETKMYRELYARHADFLAACVGTEFEMVTWRTRGDQQLSWVTQTCSTAVHGRDNVAHFSFPFEFELFYKKETIEDEKGTDEMMRWPQLYIEVLSLDSWHRYRTEGYGYITLPTSPGCRMETLNTWRPVGHSIRDELRRFFVGGSPELEDPTYVSVPSTFEGAHLSKFGFKTESTGSVTIRINTIQQSRSFLDTAASKKKLASLVDRLGGGAMQQGLAAVLESFQKARQRMLVARQRAYATGAASQVEESEA
ncbi:PREDICTED: Meckel syndrome type 1 protein-like [Priapulus caudatus]|uniref:Meckel syndrome type 1 protein-like n=1 Tax=Priapulus caudatus TaxID=37621 RepID=A0ABM1EXW1_PRICU|nr:PREDICTED: Meckel syndrome type 1 protein-like [Priapulus caudatus]